MAGVGNATGHARPFDHPQTGSQFNAALYKYTIGVLVAYFLELIFRTNFSARNIEGFLMRCAFIRKNM